MARRFAIAILCTGLLAGCPNDLDRFHVVCDGAVAGDGGPGPDGPGGDGAIANCACGAGPDVPAGCAACDCPLPALLVLVESIDGSLSNAGSISILSLAGAGAACGELTGGNTIPSQPASVSWFPPNSIAVGSDGKMALLNPRFDMYRWVYDPPCCAAGWPRAAFPLSRPGTGVVVAAGYYNFVGDNEIRYVETYDPVSGTPIDNWLLNDTASPLKLGLSIVDATRSPADPTHLMVFKEFDYAAADIAAPFDGMPAYPTTYVQALPSGSPDSIHAVRLGDLQRVVWVGSAPSGQSEAVYFVNDTGSGPMLAGPLRCGDPKCFTPNVYWHAVADPNDSTGVIAVCDGDDTGTVRHVVAFNQAGSCEVLLDGDTLPHLSRPVRLDIAY